jgi:hypothetical protein
VKSQDEHITPTGRSSQGAFMDNVHTILVEHFFLSDKAQLQCLLSYVYEKIKTISSKQARSYSRFYIVSPLQTRMLTC